jgi:hypothetical protein
MTHGIRPLPIGYLAQAVDSTARFPSDDVSAMRWF